MNLWLLFGIYLAKEGDRSKGEFIKIHREIELPIAKIKPIILGKTIFFVEGGGRKINSLFYSQEKGGFQIADITAYSEHIFASGIKEIIGSNSPFSMIFAVLKNGSFATFTYSQDLKIMGWSQHWLGGNGLVLSITPLYADSEDRLYFHVRRQDDISVNSKEYIEVLLTRYFSAKAFEMHKPLYVDCYVTASTSLEKAISRAVNSSIKNDSAAEFRGSITKLERIIQSQAENILKLPLDDIDIGTSFKYRNKFLKEHEDAENIEAFLKLYYKEYLPVILESIGASFAFHRIYCSCLAILENIFSGSHEELEFASIKIGSSLETLLSHGEKLGGDICDSISKINSWDLPDEFTGAGASHIIDYLANSAFSFCPAICSKIKLMNPDLIRSIISLTRDIVLEAKNATYKHFEVKREVKEMRLAASLINKRMLQYYTELDGKKELELLDNLKNFFAAKNKTIDFYNELKNIAHPILTEYLFSFEIKAFINEEIEKLNLDSTKAEVEASIRNITNFLIVELNKQAANRNIKSIKSASPWVTVGTILKGVRELSAISRTGE